MRLAPPALLCCCFLAIGSPAAAATLDVRVAASSDDAEQDLGSTTPNLTSSDLELVTDGSTLQTLGMRFRGLTLPQGASITNAWLQLQVDEVSTAAASLSFRAQAADDPPAFTTGTNDLSGRAVGAASVAWAPPSWPTIDVAGADQRTPSLAALVQEVVNRPGWASGNALVLIVTGSGRRTAEAFDGVAAAAPLLHVEYDTSGIDQLPSVTISAPANNSSFALGAPVVFGASASDFEDGNLTASLAWSSNRDGAIGFGGAFTTSTLSAGTHIVTASVSDSFGHVATATRQLEIGADFQVFVGAGDISECSNDHDEETAALLDNIPGTVFTVGDNVYNSGTLTEYNNCYGPTWGRHKARTRPATGNHEYDTTNASGYFSYFGASAGDPANGLYSYDLGAWHIIVLNSECAKIGGCTRTSAQGQWLQADLAAHPNTCTLAITHKARFGSGPNGDHTILSELWDLLYEAGADVVLSGHDHNYERFGPQNPQAQADSRGIRQFIVGMGGAGLSPVGTPHANSQASNGNTYGVLKLTLRPTSFDWEFVPAPGGGGFTDAGSAACVSAGPVNALPQVTLTAPADGASFAVNTAVSFAGTASDFEDGSLTNSLVWTSDRDGQIGVGGSFVTSALSAGAHLITARATDSAGGIGQRQVSITLTVAGAATTQRRIAAGADDAEERVSDGRMTLTSTDLELIFDKRDQVVGLRFTGIAVPKNAPILDAYVQFKVDETLSAAASLNIQGEAADDSAPFTSALRSVSARPRTTASVTWTPAAWPTVGQAGSAQRTPSLASLVQQVVDRPGWVSGNDLALVFTGAGVRTAEAFEGDAAGAPLLVIQYVAP